MELLVSSRLRRVGASFRRSAAARLRQWPGGAIVTDKARSGEPVAPQSGRLAGGGHGASCVEHRVRVLVRAQLFDSISNFAESADMRWPGVLYSRLRQSDCAMLGDVR